jgi:hypothetical protein
MRFLLLLAALIGVAACSSGGSDSATLVINNRRFDQVRVQAIITKSTNCNDPSRGYLATKELFIRRDRPEQVEAPNAEYSICFRHERYPGDPSSGWTGWSRATLFPNTSVETDL